MAGTGGGVEELLPPGHAPQRSPVPAGLLDWFHDGAADLAERFRTTAPDEQVWTWSADRTVGFCAGEAYYSC